MVMGWMEGERCMHAQGEEEREHLCALKRVAGWMLAQGEGEGERGERAHTELK